MDYKFNGQQYMTIGIREKIPEVVFIYLLKIMEKRKSSDIPMDYLQVFEIEDNETILEITHVSVVSIGTLNSSMAHPREIYKVAVMSNANSIIIAHNHPSGDVKPSKEDISITKRLKQVGEIIVINLIDHIIIGSKDRYTSLKEMDIL